MSLVRETCHLASPMSNLLSSFPRKRMLRMVRIKDTTCGFPPLFSLAPPFSSPRRRKMFLGFCRAPSLLYLSPLFILSLVTPLSISLFYSFSFSSLEDFYRMQKRLKLSLKCCFCSTIRGRAESARISVKILPNGFEIARRKLRGRKHYNRR